MSSERESDEELSSEELLENMDPEEISEKVDYNEFYGEPEADRKRRKPIPFIITAVAVLTAVLVAVAVIVERNTPGKEYADLYTYYGIDSNEMAVVYDGTICGKGLYTDGIPYLSKEFVTEYLTDKFYFDEGRGCLLYTTESDIYEIPMAESEYFIGNVTESTDYVIAVRDNGTVYIAVEFLEDKAAFTYNVYNNPNRVVLIPDGSVIADISFTESARIRTDASIKADIIGVPGEESGYWYVSDEATAKNWVAVVNPDGRRGYIKEKEILTKTDVRFDSGYEEKEYTSCRKDYDIVMVWHAVYSSDSNSNIASLLENTKGVTTVSPTWYKISDETGGILSMADKDYVEYIHSLGMEIWPLISDFTSVEGDGWDRKALFDNTENRRRLIDNIINEIIFYGYDGINIDFEHISAKEADGFIQFIRELSIRCRKEKVVLSIDNYVPMAHSLHYNRKAQGECADYIIVMGYDEHYRGGGEAGSVASISFVENGITNTLKEVPDYKIINGIPFYTRLWKESIDEYGNNVLDSTAYSMDNALAAVEELGLNTEWDSEVKQYVAKGMADDIYYSIWLEEDSSIAAKMELVKKYNLSGIAAWCLGMEKSSVWDIITE